VAGATVTVVNTGTNATRTVNTNDAGEYSFPSLQPGMYTVKVEKTGFKSVVRNQIELQVQLAARIDFELQIGQVSESVEVRADAALLVTDNETVGTVIENKRIVELPLNGGLSATGLARSEGIDRFFRPGASDRAAGGHPVAADDFRRRTAHQFQSLHA
jgi:Carboxypeptidase regulatory-like domain